MAGNRINNRQIRLLQIAVKKAGLRSKNFDGRYRLLLGQYKQSNGRPVTSSVQLNSYQLEDLLAICESYGWQCPGKDANHFRKKAAASGKVASTAQQQAIEHLGRDLGWNEYDLGGMINRMTGGKSSSVVTLAPRQAYNIIEALKAILSRKAGKKYNKLNEIKDDFGRESTHVKETSQVE